MPESLKSEEVFPSIDFANINVDFLSKYGFVSQKQGETHTKSKLNSQRYEIVRKVVTRVT